MKKEKRHVNVILCDKKIIFEMHFKILAVDTLKQRCQPTQRIIVYRSLSAPNNESRRGWGRQSVRLLIIYSIVRKRHREN